MGVIISKQPVGGDVEHLVSGIEKGDRVCLSRAITLIESKKIDHKIRARKLLTSLQTTHRQSYRIGITGLPGAGKSTLIDALGLMLTKRGHRIAVLAVDPSSSRSGGAILGDKTRMAQLSANENAFVRPSPSSGTLGGVARTTRETILICEAAGYDIILVETVGVGQSEVTVAEMVDFFLVLMLAGGGDELQGIKKGVMELADMIAITKADGENELRAKTSAIDYRAALLILTPAQAAWLPPVIIVSAQDNKGLDSLLDHIQDFRSIMQNNGAYSKKRRDQDIRWLHALIHAQLHDTFLRTENAKHDLKQAEEAILKNHIPPSIAADDFMEKIRLNLPHHANISI